MQTNLPLSINSLKEGVLANVLEKTPFAFSLMSEDYVVDFANDTYLEIVGKAREEVIGKNPRILMSGRHQQAFYAGMWAASKRGEVGTGEVFSQRRLGGDVQPVVVNVCNFAKGDPALLSYDDARTLFHEFGHALHQMLSDVTYGFISGTSVARDFVELPSQLYEHWLEVPEVLEKHARHWQTGAAMPADMLQRLLAAGTYDQGFATVEFLSSAFVDLAFHEGTPPADPMQKQAEVLESLGMPRAIRMRHATPHFAHVFSGDGYSSGYYSYMWSEVMDADAFAAFEAEKHRIQMAHKRGQEDPSQGALTQAPVRAVDLHQVHRQPAFERIQQQGQHRADQRAPRHVAQLRAGAGSGFGDGDDIRQC